MEQKFSNNRIDLQGLREFCEREGEAVEYRKGDQLEREGDPFSVTSRVKMRGLMKKVAIEIYIFLV